MKIHAILIFSKDDLFCVRYQCNGRPKPVCLEWAVLLACGNAPELLQNYSLIFESPPQTVPRHTCLLDVVCFAFYIQSMVQSDVRKHRFLAGLSSVKTFNVLKWNCEWFTELLLFFHTLHVGYFRGLLSSCHSDPSSLLFKIKTYTHKLKRLNNDAAMKERRLLVANQCCCLSKDVEEDVDVELGPQTVTIWMVRCVRFWWIYSQKCNILFIVV